MKVAKLSERLMGMDDATWERHANPWSGWSRITILPLLCLAIWSRVWIGNWFALTVMVVLIWTWINPRLFHPPKSDHAWMTRAVRGEQLLLAGESVSAIGHHRQVARLLAYGSGTGCLIIAWALWTSSPGLLFAGLILAMGAKLWFLDRMVWLFEENRNFPMSTGGSSDLEDIARRESW